MKTKSKRVDHAALALAWAADVIESAIKNNEHYAVHSTRLHAAARSRLVKRLRSEAAERLGSA